MNTQIKTYIEEHRDELISLLTELLEKKSPDEGDTDAQETVLRELNRLGFTTECFQGE